MGFNFNKYDGVSFHKDEMIHKKIKALLVWFEYKAQDLSLSYNEKIQLLDNIIKQLKKKKGLDHFYVLFNHAHGDSEDIKKILMGI